MDMVDVDGGTEGNEGEGGGPVSLSLLQHDAVDTGTLLMDRFTYATKSTNFAVNGCAKSSTTADTCSNKKGLAEVGLLRERNAVATGTLLIEEPTKFSSPVVNGCAESLSSASTTAANISSSSSNSKERAEDWTLLEEPTAVEPSTTVGSNLTTSATRQDDAEAEQGTITSTNDVSTKSCSHSTCPGVITNDMLYPASRSSSASVFPTGKSSGSPNPLQQPPAAPGPPLEGSTTTASPKSTIPLSTVSPKESSPETVVEDSVGVTGTTAAVSAAIFHTITAQAQDRGGGDDSEDTVVIVDDDDRDVDVNADDGRTARDKTTVATVAESLARSTTSSKSNSTIKKSSNDNSNNCINNTKGCSVSDGELGISTGNREGGNVDGSHFRAGDENNSENNISTSSISSKHINVVAEKGDKNGREERRETRKGGKTDMGGGRNPGDTGREHASKCSPFSCCSCATVAVGSSDDGHVAVDVETKNVAEVAAVVSLPIPVTSAVTTVEGAATGGDKAPMGTRGGGGGDVDAGAGAGARECGCAVNSEDELRISSADARGHSSARDAETASPSDAPVAMPEATLLVGTVAAAAAAVTAKGRVKARKLWDPDLQFALFDGGGVVGEQKGEEEEEEEGNNGGSGNGLGNGSKKAVEDEFEKGSGNGTGNVSANKGAGNSAAGAPVNGSGKSSGVGLDMENGSRAPSVAGSSRSASPTPSASGAGGSKARVPIQPGRAVWGEDGNTLFFLNHEGMGETHYSFYICLTARRVSGGCFFVVIFSLFSSCVPLVFRC